MGKFTDKLVKKSAKTEPKPFGIGAAATVTAILDEERETTVEHLIETYAGKSAVGDLHRFLHDDPQPNQRLRISRIKDEETAAADVIDVPSLIVYLDPSNQVAFVRSSPESKNLHWSHPVERFIPDQSLESFTETVASDV